MSSLESMEEALYSKNVAELTAKIEVEARNYASLHQHVESSPEGKDLLTKFDDAKDVKGKKMVLLTYTKEKLEEKKKLHGEIGELKSTRMALAEHVQSQDSQIKSLKKEAETQRMSNLNYERKEKAMEKENLKIRQENHVLISEKEKVEANVKLLMDQTKDLKQKNAELTSTHTSLGNEIQKIKQEQELLIKQNGTLEKTKEDLKNQVRHLNEEYMVYRKEMEQKTGLVSEYVQKIRDLECEAANFKAQILQSCEAEEKWLLEKQSYEEEVECLKKEKEELTVLASSNAKDASNQAQQVSERDEEIQGLRAHIAEMSDRLTRCQTELHKVTDSHSYLADLKMQLDERVNTCMLDIAKLEEENTFLKRIKSFEEEQQSLVTKMAEVKLQTHLSRMEGVMNEELRRLREDGERSVQQLHADLKSGHKQIYDISIEINTQVTEILDKQNVAPEQTEAVEKLPDDIKEFCWKIQDLVGPSVKDFARTIGLNPPTVEKVVSDSGLGLRDQFWRIICECCSELKEKFTISSVVKAYQSVALEQAETKSMSPQHCSILTKHSSLLAENLMVTLVLIYMRNTGLVTTTTYNYILAPRAIPDQVMRLLDILPTLGETAFEGFVHALNQSGQSHIAEILQDELKSEAETARKLTCDDDDESFEVVETPQKKDVPQNHQKTTSQTKKPNQTSHGQYNRYDYSCLTKQDLDGMEWRLKTFIKQQIGSENTKGDS